MAAITKFKGKHEFLTNMLECRVDVFDLTFNSAEAAYQAAKSKDPEVRKRIAAIKNPYKAKEAGKKIDKRSDWELVKVDVMEEVLRAKFRDKRLRQLLVDTGKAKILHVNKHGDDFWGVIEDTQEGRNELGNILMKLRDEFKTE